MTQHDPALNTTYAYRGNVSNSTTPAGSQARNYDIGGNVTSKTVNGVTTTIATNTSTNYAAPSAITTNSLSSSMNWTTFLGLSSATGPNGDTGSAIYDTTARPSSTTSPYGAVTTYTYNDNASPPTTVAAVNGRQTVTTVDGFGRTAQVTAKDANNTYSTVQTVYAPCGCSPLGKMSQVSQPYAPGGTVYYTTYAYDGTGRTKSVAASDGEQAQLSGTVKLHVRVDKTGSVINVAVMSGQPVLSKAAVENMKLWRFWSSRPSAKELPEFDFIYVFKLEGVADSQPISNFVYDYPNTVTITSQSLHWNP